MIFLKPVEFVAVVRLECSPYFLSMFVSYYVYFVCFCFQSGNSDVCSLEQYFTCLKDFEGKLIFSIKYVYPLTLRNDVYGQWLCLSSERMASNTILNVSLIDLCLQILTHDKAKPIKAVCPLKGSTVFSCTNICKRIRITN